MPPKRSTRTASRTPSAQQSKLSFHGRPNKVTKQSNLQQSKQSKKDPALVEDVVQSESEVKDEPEVIDVATEEQDDEGAAPDPLQSTSEPTKTEDVLGGRAQESDAGAVGGRGSGWVADEEEQARKISDAQIKQYWRRKEQERLAPRVHQEDLTVYEKVLREWDMSGQYGVCFHSG